MSILLAALLVTARPSSAYRIENAAAPAGAPILYVQPFVDARPDTERTGAEAGFGNRATKDAMFSDSVQTALTWAFADELRVRGVDARVLPAGEVPPIGHPVVSGEIRSYTSRLYTPRTASIPYVSWITWMWTHDRIAGEVDIRLNLWRPSQPVWQETFKASSSDTAWVGPLHLSERGRYLTRKEIYDSLIAAGRHTLGQAAARCAEALAVPPQQ